MGIIVLDSIACIACGGSGLAGDGLRCFGCEGCGQVCPGCLEPSTLCDGRCRADAGDADGSQSGGMEVKGEVKQ